MSLRKRLSFVAAIAVGVAVVLAACVSYFVVRGQLFGQVDGALKAQEAAIQDHQLRIGQPLPGIPASAGGPSPYTQVVLSDGSVPVGNIRLPVSSRVMSAANGNGGQFLSTSRVGRSDLRILTFPARVGINLRVENAAIQLARPLNGTDHILAHLRLILLLLIIGGIALAAALGRLAARRVLAPLAEVAQTAEQIGETDDLSHRLRIHADDEVGQLATRFNHMLERLEGSRAALDESVRAQRQLVADASHELRTPVTSLRTNIEVLLAGAELDEEDRRRLLTDVVEQSEELSGLVGDLIELARGDLPIESAEDLRLDRIVEDSVARAHRNSPAVRFETELTPVTVEGVPERLSRAINNLLDNAARHSPPGETVEVTVESGGIRVRDHGPGIAEEDLPYVFDRFFRGASSRGKQGSGLGLAIVRQVAQQHHGSVSAENAPDGGALFWLRLPTAALDEPPSRPHDEPATVGDGRGGGGESDSGGQDDRGDPRLQDSANVRITPGAR